MSYSLSYLKTHRNCINTSSTKQIYSFNRSSRFHPSQSKNLTSNIQYKNIPAIFKKDDKKGFTFFKSNQSSSCSSLVEKAKTPSPAKYSLNGFFTTAIKNDPSFSIGKRIKTEKIPNLSPGPAKYTVSTSNLRKKERFSFSRAKRQMDLAEKGKDSPGPIFKLEAEKLKEVVSKYKSPKYIKIMDEMNTLNVEKRREKLRKQQQKNKIILKKKEKLQKIQQYKYLFPKEKGVIFQKQKRRMFEPDKNPGPGSYIVFSEFAKAEKPLEGRAFHKNIMY